ncbi:hypothetical protein PPL_06857 [Heterostelium album PN500]|uniref:Uncharacterized protein n=1 Tax=Heterostelium pallidum (strain ATCC 26659 / Pp 5 / PN500) TaxID=670386 RepID=D3BDQ5_HETP5|nr:hypothetical protein PPL_06857 [Heterostelium album PN500]EFA80036.1 hypothetical protein PPL_06857 [Heterostelium album PN500]|eukprot:XP_020432156.1 hypothetical protein PPL_06857 [Heterostelium album PN500]
MVYKYGGISYKFLVGLISKGDIILQANPKVVPEEEIQPPAIPQSINHQANQPLEVNYENNGFINGICQQKVIKDFKDVATDMLEKEKQIAALERENKLLRERVDAQEH